ncbi:MAG: hypothetical protein II674_00060 [Prevotella sp.]|nr:hypothetical protein [Prevotella sp.]
MKKLFFMFVAAAAMTFAACDNAPKTEAAPEEAAEAAVEAVDSTAEAAVEAVDSAAAAATETVDSADAATEAATEAPAENN